MKINHKDSAMNSHPRQPLARMLGAGLIGALASAPIGNAMALTWDVGDADVSLETSISAGVAWRTGSRDERLVAIANGGSLFSTNSDDGNLAFDRGDAITSPLKITSDFGISWGDFGLFVRGSAGYNPVLEDKQFFDPADYGAGKERPESERRQKTEAVRDEVGSYAELLDAYVYANFEVLDRYLTIRAGRQIINWGESTLVQNGLNSLLALNANRLRSPGFELEEVLIPVGMVWVAMDLFENVSAEGFYQYEWERTEPDASGTFFATNDFAFIGGTQANLGFGRAGENESPCQLGGTVPQCATVPFGSTIPRGTDNNPEDGGQYGGALRFFVPFLNDMDLSLYAANYHSRLPLFSGTTSQVLPDNNPATQQTNPTNPAVVDSSSYFVEYPEDIQLYGMSFNTTVETFGVAVQGEYSYKVGQPLQLEDIELFLTGLGFPSQIQPVPGAALGGNYLRGWRRHDVSQVDLSFTKILGPQVGIGADQVTFLTEFAATQVHGLPDPDVLAYEAPNTTLPMNPLIAAASGVPTETGSYATDFSWGYKFVTRLQYNNAFGSVNLEPTFLWQHDVEGYTPAPIVNFVEDRRSATAILGWDYLNRWSGGVAWQRNFGGGIQNASGDRDFASVHLKYSF